MLGMIPPTSVLQVTLSFSMKSCRNVTAQDRRGRKLMIYLRNKAKEKLRAKVMRSIVFLDTTMR